jgi:hypothetical protein
MVVSLADVNLAAISHQRSGKASAVPEAVMCRLFGCAATA